MKIMNYFKTTLLLVFFAIAHAGLSGEEAPLKIETSSPLTYPPTTRKARDVCVMLADRPDDLRQLKELGKGIQDIFNPGDKAPFMAIFALGNMAAGNSQTAAAARDYMKKQIPNSPYTALLAFENISSECAYCHGSGKISVTCKRCSGTGKCSLCQGTGKISFGDEEKPCSICGGTGKCRECNGEGTIQQTCRQCGGRGKVISRDTVLQMYSDMLKQHKSVTDFTLRTKETIESEDYKAFVALIQELEEERTKNVLKDKLHFKIYASTLTHLINALNQAKPDEPVPDEPTDEKPGQ